MQIIPDDLFICESKDIRWKRVKCHKTAGGLMKK